jgi:hypothetical protein
MRRMVSLSDHQLEIVTTAANACRSSGVLFFWNGAARF